jgi:hypothetical protein
MGTIEALESFAATAGSEWTPFTKLSCQKCTKTINSTESWPGTEFWTALAWSELSTKFHLTCNQLHKKMRVIKDDELCLLKKCLKCLSVMLLENNDIYCEYAGCCHREFLVYWTTCSHCGHHQFMEDMLDVTEPTFETHSLTYQDFPRSSKVKQIQTRSQKSHTFKSHHRVDNGQRKPRPDVFWVSLRLLLPLRVHHVREMPQGHLQQVLKKEEQQLGRNRGPRLCHPLLWLLV